MGERSRAGGRMIPARAPARPIPEAAGRILPLLVIAFLAACVPAEEPVGPRAEFRDAAERLRNSDFQYQGLARLRELEALQQAPPESRPERIQLEVMLAREKLSHGRTAEATGHIDRALRMIEVDIRAMRQTGFR